MSAVPAVAVDEAVALPALRFSPPNEKMVKTGKVLGTRIQSFNLPALKSQRDGFTTCPGAGVCASICYARQGWYYRPVVRDLREDNLVALRGMNIDEMVEAIDAGIKDLHHMVGIVRIHDSGDFFSREYMWAWFAVMERNPHLRFYAYTKMVPFFVDLILPPNFLLMYSEGGKWDAQIPPDAPRSRIFVTHEEREAAGFVDGTSSDGDLPVLMGERRVGLVYHGSNDLKPGQMLALRREPALL